jgi:hypothetical protein
MKNLLILSFFFITNLCLAQPQWKFHLAFEDATGAKDTIWLIWDTTATGGVQGSGYDTLLGEGPFNFDYSIFNVWTHNENGDSTKTLAFPYNNTIGFLPFIYAFNYQYPITIQWDSSLFYASYLPLPVGYINIATIENDYFFLVSNDPPLQRYNMLLDNHAVAPAFSWGSQTHFPMIFYIARDHTININEIKIQDVSIYPNPFTNSITVSGRVKINGIQILSLEGKIVYNSNSIISSASPISIPTDHLLPGMYLFKIINHQNHIHYEKVIKFH